MALFSLFNSTSRGKLIQSNQDSIKAMEEEFEQSKNEVDKLQAENTSWQKDFNTIINIRTKASSFEKSAKLQEAIDAYSKSVLFGEASLHLNLNNYAHDIDRLIVLYNKTKQKAELSDFLEQLILKYPDYRDAQKWKVRLSSLRGVIYNKSELTPEIIETPVPNNPTLGEKFQTFLSSFPKFNFYYDMPEGMSTFEYLSIKKPVPFERSIELRHFKEIFDTILNKARIAENENDLKAAIEAYEKLIVEECQETAPYERLMVIYKKLGWKMEERRVIQTAITFFSHLEEKQRNTVLHLAQEFNVLDKASEYVNNKRKVFYYGGAFELYNPYPIIDKWISRLLKLK